MGSVIAFITCKIDKIYHFLENLINMKYFGKIPKNIENNKFNYEFNTKKFF